MSLNNFEIKMDKGCFHLKTFRGNFTCYLGSWTIRSFSAFKYGRSEGFQNKEFFKYSIEISADQEHVKVSIASRYLPQHANLHHHYKCSVAISTDLGKILFCDTLVNGLAYTPSCDEICIKDENLKLLKQFGNDTVVLTCKIIHPRIRFIPRTSCDTLLNHLEYAKLLQADLKKYPSDSLKEKVELRVGQETETVHKAVICARSPVFAKMFQNDMREVKENTVTITDFKMPVLRALVSFLNTGILQDCDLNFLCDLYYTADKYQIKELQSICTGSIIQKISLQNIFQVLQLSLLHNDELLNSAVMALISANFEAVELTPFWKKLMNEDSETASRASAFFDF